MRYSYFIIGILVLTSVAQAIESCNREYIRGDANGDGVINIGDPIYELFYLFSGGAEPYCLQAGDVNGDSNIDLTDPIYILNFLFKNGPSPINELGQEEIFGADPVDNAPELGFLYLDSNEITLQNLPTTFFVLDSSGERDIRHCSVYADSEFGRFSILETDWESEGFTGNDISNFPLAFVIGQEGDGILPRFSYTLTVQCQDMAGQEDIIELKINVVEEKEIIQTCRNGQDIACIYFGEPTLADDAVVCLYDSDYNEETGEDGICEPHQSQCYVLNGVPVPGGHITEIGEWKPTSTSTYDSYPENKQMGFVDPCLERISDNKNNLEFIPLQSPGGSPEQSTTKKPCWVEKMTIYRTKDKKPDNFNIPKEILSPAIMNEVMAKNKISSLPIPATEPPDPLLGPNEGYSIVQDPVTFSNKINYVAGYAFLPIATLYKGSDPESCEKGQFVQQSIIENQQHPAGTVRGEFMRAAGKTDEEKKKYMLSGEDIRKKKSLKEISQLDVNGVAVKTTQPGFSVAVDRGAGFVPVPEGITEAAKFKENSCPTGGNLWCSDDYNMERTGIYLGPGLTLKTGDYQKHLRGTEANAPKIIWWDNPGPKDTLLGKLGVQSVKYNFISIVEDSHPRSPDESGNIWRQRFRCELDGLDIMKGGNPAGQYKITLPTCVCISERRLEGGPNFVQGKTSEWSEISRENC